MSQGKPVPRVQGGVPWWLWLIAGAATLVVFVGIFSGRSDDDPNVLFEQAVSAAESYDTQTFADCLSKLREFDSAADQVAILEGIQAGGTGRDPRALKLLSPYIEHENERYRRIAVRFAATCAQRMGDAARARDLYQMAIEFDPSNPLLHRQLATLYEEAGAFQPALEEARAFRELEPENRDAALMMAGLLLKQRRLDEALENFESLLDSDGERISASPESVLKYLDCLIKLDRADEAFEFIEDNPALVMNDPSIRLQVYLKSHKYEQAKALLESLNLMYATNPMIMRIRAEEAIDNEDWDLAVDLLTQGAVMSPRSREIFELLELAASKKDLPELVQTAEANVAALRDLENQLQQAIVDIGDDVESTELRMDVVRLSLELGQFNEARDWIRSAALVSPDRQAELTGMVNAIKVAATPLVPFSEPLDAADADEDSAGQSESGDGNEAPASAGDGRDGDSGSAGQSAPPDSTEDSPVDDEPDAEPVP